MHVGIFAVLVLTLTQPPYVHSLWETPFAVSLLALHTYASCWLWNIL